MRKGLWLKSSFSNGTGGSNCVEVKHKTGRMISIRDSKQNDDPYQKELNFTPEEWQAFIDGVKSGEFDL